MGEPSGEGGVRRDKRDDDREADGGDTPTAPEGPPPSVSNGANGSAAPLPSPDDTGEPSCGEVVVRDGRSTRLDRLELRAQSFAGAERLWARMAALES